MMAMAMVMVMVMMMVLRDGDDVTFVQCLVSFPPEASFALGDTMLTRYIF